MKTTVSPRPGVGFVFTLMALLALGPNATNLRADGPPVPPEITYTILNLWLFQPTNSFVGIRGGSPLVATNLIFTTNAWGSEAVHFSTNNAMLRYPEAWTNSTRTITNMVVDDGCIRFWYRNHWQSTSLGGTGPGTYGRLIEVGDSSSTNGYWTLYLSPQGTNLSFASTTNGAVGGVYLSAPIQWDSNCWHMINLNYNSSNCQLFLDGQLVSTNTGLTYWPGPDARTNGWTIGGDSHFTNLIKGDISSLYTARGYFSAEIVSNSYDNMTYYYSLGPDGGGDSMAPSFGGDLSLGEDYDPTCNGLPCCSFAGTALTGFTGNDHPWLLIPVYQVTNQQTNILLTIDGGTSGVAYGLFGTTLLFGDSITNSNWTLLGYGNSGQTYSVAPVSPGWPYTFYTVRGTNDTDGDGLTDAYERLVSKTSISNVDTDGDGMPDAWEVANGLNPLANDASGDPDGDGWTNLQEYRGGTSPGAAAPMEIFIAHPISSSNLP